MTSKAQSEGIPQDCAPSRYSVGSIARKVSIFLFLCGMIAVQLQPTQSVERAQQTGAITEDLLNTVQLKAPLVNAVKGIRAHRRLLSEDNEELEDSEYPTRRLKGKGGKGGRGRNGGRSSGKGGGSKGRSKGSKGSTRFSRSQTFSPFPTETPFPTSTPFPTVTPFPTITPYPTGMLHFLFHLFEPCNASKRLI